MCTDPLEEKKLKRGDKVRVVLEGSFLNYCNEGIGIRLTDKQRPAFRSVVPLYAVEQLENKS